MRLTDSPLLNIIIIVALIILLLVVLWLLNESRKRKYYEDAIRYILAPERAPVPLTTWGQISAPDANGVMTSKAAATLDGLNDQVQLTLQSKDRPQMEEYTKNVKFRFIPIYTPPPVDIFQ